VTLTFGRTVFVFLTAAFLVLGLLFAWIFGVTVAAGRVDDAGGATGDWYEGVVETC
jgi:hypothetical protein